VTRREPEVARAWAVLGALRDLKGDETGAMSAFEAGLAASPDNSELLINQANFHLRHERPEAAKKALEAAVRASPGDAEAWKLLGEVCRLGNLPAEAAQCELMFQRCQQ
jgi:predicted Zn-dependent protease